MTDGVLVPLTKGKMALIDAEDLPVVSQHSWHVTSDNGGRQGYASTVIRRRKVGMARLLLDAEAGEVVDHINGDTLDNRRANLRRCLQRENAQNKRRSVSNATGFKGVSFDSRDNRYRATIGAGGRHLALGGYADPLQAAVAYDKAAKRLHGEFASLNFAPDRDWILPEPLPLRGSPL